MPITQTSLMIQFLSDLGCLILNNPPVGVQNPFFSFLSVILENHNVEVFFLISKLRFESLSVH